MMRAAARRARAVRTGTADEGGFALLFVLFVGTMVMLGTATMLTVVTNNVRPARASQDSYAALAAAQSGIQDYLAHLNANCRSVSVEACTWLKNTPTLTGTIGEQSYSVSALNNTRYLDANGGTVRVVSTGTANGPNGATKSLTADLSGKPSVLRFTYFSNYETLGTAFLRSYYRDRTITLSDSTTAATVGLPARSIVHWNGTASAPADGYTDTVCDALYYDDPSNPVALGGKGRGTVAAGRTALAPGTNFTEDGYTLAGNPVTGVLLPLAQRTAVSRDAACEVQFSKGARFTGPVYSRDALFLTNGEVGSATGPSFTVPAAEPLPPVSTAWSTASRPAPSDGTKPYRTDPILGGTPVTSSGRQAVSTFAQQLTLPATADPAADCTYTGPTRIVLNGGNATVNSPLTPGVSGSTCYTPATSGTGVQATVPITSTILKIKNSATAMPGAAPSFPGYSLGGSGDITTYSTSAGDAYVQGSLTSGRLSLVAAHDIVVTGDVTTTKTVGTNSAGERAWGAGAAIDLVAVNDVRIYHPVSCASGSATDGYCPNDISGLYTSAESNLVARSDGTLRPTHPSRQYQNIGTTGDRRIEAAVMALSGSLLVDNFNRGAALGTLVVDGGVYLNHRGAIGQLWEVPTTAVAGTRPSSGYAWRIDYLSYASAGLPFVPVLDNGASAASPWTVLTVSSGAAR